MYKYGGLNKNPTLILIKFNVLDPTWWNYLGEISVCSFVGGGMLLCLWSSKILSMPFTCISPSLSSAYGSDLSSQLLLHAFLPAAVLPDLMFLDSPALQLYASKKEAFFYILSWLWWLSTGN